jgi:hypothetical protein
VALVAGPALIVGARLVSVPWDDSHPGEYVQNVADSPLLSDIGASLVVLAASISIAGMVYLTQIARTHRPRLGLVGGVLAIAGYIGMIGMGTKSLDAGQIVRHTPTETASSLSKHLALDVPTIDLLIISGTIGYILLAVCLFGSPQSTRVMSILIGFAGVTTIFTSGGPIRVLIVATAALLLLGQGWLAATVTRRPETNPVS